MHHVGHLPKNRYMMHDQQNVKKADNNLQHLFQETQYDDVPVSGRPTDESSHGESDRRRTECLVINSVPFAVDPEEHFVKFGSQREEADRVRYNRHRLPVVVHLDKDGIRNGMSTV